MLTGVPLRIRASICPGRRFADVGIWLAMASIMAIFDIRKAKDDDGGEITPPLSFIPGSVRHVASVFMQAGDC